MMTKHKDIIHRPLIPIIIIGGLHCFSIPEIVYVKRTEYYIIRLNDG